MATNVIQKVKGTRDFYPEQMAFRQWLYGKIRAVSEKYGYVEYDGPEIELMELYTSKTSEEIVREQAFTMQDRDGRALALRPELTPTLARMIAQKGEELQFPLRWYSFGRAWRYEQPQKGRGREFFQWEIDILGVKTPEADAEILAIAADYFRAVGLTPEEVVIRVSDRSFLEETFASFGIGGDQFKPVLRVIDRKEKVSAQEFAAGLKAEGLNDEQVAQINDFFDRADYSGSEWLVRLFETLKNFEGVSDYIVFDPIIARGFDYYTGVVFEAWDRTGQFTRSLFGGGRFDNLTATFGGKQIPAQGMAPGDMPIEVLLRQFNKMPDLKVKTADVLVTVFSSEQIAQSQKLAGELRQVGLDVELWPDDSIKMGKQLDYANKRGIPAVAIIGPGEAERGAVTLKWLATGEQTEVARDNVADKLREASNA